MATPSTAVAARKGTDPYQLVNELREIIAVATGCGDHTFIDWSRHYQSMTVAELVKVADAISAHIIKKQFEAQRLAEPTS